jgi:hypothetical protein
MKNQMQVGSVVVALSSVTVLSVMTSGCGGAKALVNNNIPEVDNLLKLNDTEIDSSVGGVTRALIIGGLDKTATFDDKDLPEKNRINFVKLKQGLDKAVRVTVPQGKTLPATFTLSNITLDTVVSDGDGATKRTVTGSATVAGPVTFTQTGSSNIYTTTATVEPEVNLSANPFKTFRDIVTTAPSPNTATVKLRFDADDTQLPAGSVIRFKFVGGKAKVGI